MRSFCASKMPVYIEEASNGEEALVWEKESEELTYIKGVDTCSHLILRTMQQDRTDQSPSKGEEAKLLVGPESKPKTV